MKVTVPLGLLLAATLVTVAGCATTGTGEGSPETPVEEVPLEQLLADADESLRSGDLDAAQVSFALVVERDPENVEALYRLAVIHREKGGLSVAEGLLRAALRVRKGHQGSREALGIVLLEQERLDEAETTLLDALEGRPGSWQVMNALGVIYDMRARHEDAQEMFTAALNASPRSAKLSNNLGYSFYLDGDYDRAERHIRDATRFDPEYGRAWSNLALVYAKLERYRDATAAFDRILERHQSANNLGYLGLLEGNATLARTQLEKAVRLSPAYYEVANENLAAMPGFSIGSNTDVTRKEAGVGSRDLPVPLPIVATATPTEPSAPAARPPARRKPSPASMPLRPALAFVGFGAPGDDDRALSDAVGRFQEAYGLEADGNPGRKTRAKLLEVVVKRLQGKLVALGYDAGTPDGRLGRRTSRAIRAFEKDEELPSTGRPVASVLERIEFVVDSAVRKIKDDDRLDYSARG